MPAPIHIAAGTCFHYLTVIGPVAQKADGNQRYFATRCTCGRRFNVRSHELRNGITRSCGCKATELMLESRAKAKGEVWAGSRPGAGLGGLLGAEGRAEGPGPGAPSAREGPPAARVKQGSPGALSARPSARWAESVDQEVARLFRQWSYGRV